MKKVFALILAMAMTASIALTGCGGGGSTDSTTQPAESSGTEDTTTPEETDAPAEAPSTTPTAAGDSKTLIWNIGVDPKTFDPGLNAATDGSEVINNTFEGLMRNKNDGNGLVPAVAEAEPEITDNADGTQTWVFKLRDSKWSDGKPVVAGDFAYAWKRLVDPATASEYAFIASPILNATEITAGEKAPDELGVEAVDDKTLKITLTRPCGYFLELCSSTSMMPVREDLADPDGLWAKDPAKAVSNGPFYLTAYTMGDQAVFEKNPNYWNADAVKIDKIVGKMIVEESTAITGFRNGEIDINDKVPNEEIPQLVASGEVMILPALSNQFYVINQNTTVEALKDKKVRQAMSKAIDRKKLVENVTRGGQKPMGGIIPFGMAEPDGQDYREKTGLMASESADIEGAKALLAEAGYPNGEGIGEIEILYNTNEGNKAIAEAIQEMWSQIGLNVTLNNQEWAVFQSTRNQVTPSYPAVARHSWNADYTDPQTFLDMFMTGNAQSGCGYSNPDFDAKIEAAMAAQGQERYDLFREAEAILVDDAYVIPFYSGVAVAMAQPRVQNWSRNSLGWYWFGDVELTA